MAFDQTSGLRGYPDVGPMRPTDAAALEYGSQTRARTAGLRSSLRMSPYTPPTPAQGLSSVAAETAEAARPANALSRGVSRVVSAAKAAPGAVARAPAALGRVTGAVATGVAPWVAPALEAQDVAKVATDKNATGLDVTTQAAEGLGRSASAYLGAKGGAAIGAAGGPLAPVTVPLGAVVGGLAGYYGADKMIRLGREEFAPNSVASPVDQIPQRATDAAAAAARAPANPNQTEATYRRLGMPVPTSVSTAAPDGYGGRTGYGSGRGAVNPPTVGQAAELSAYLASGGDRGTLPTDLSRLEKGAVYKTVDPKTGRTIYSGRDVSPGARVLDANGRQQGNLNNDLRGEGVLTYDANGRVITAAGRDGAPLGPGTLRGQATNPGPMMPVSQSFGDGGVTAGTPSGGLAGFGDSSKPTLQTQLQDQLQTALGQAKSGRMFRDRQAGARAAEALNNQLAGMQTAQGRDAAGLEGHRISGEYGLRNAMISAGASGRAAMLDFMQKQLDRRAVIEAHAAAPNDPAGYLAQKYGMLDTAGKVLGNEQTRASTGSTLQSISSARDAQLTARSNDLDDLFKSTSTRMNAQGQPEYDPLAARAKGDVLRRLMPGYATSTDKAAKERAQLQAELIGSIYGKINGGNYTGWDKVLGTEKKTDELMPELKGAKLKQYGRLNVTAGVSGRDYGLTLPGTTEEINIGQLSKRQLEAIDDMTKNGVNFLGR